MGKLSKNESGFSALEVILIIVIVALVGFTGWYVYSSQQKANKNLAATTSGNPTFKKVTKPTVTKTTKQPATSQKYLTITEWGVRAPYTSNDTLTYVLKGDSAMIVSKNLADSYGCTTFGAGGISRLTPDSIVDPGPDTVAQVAKANPNDYKYIAGYYYSFGHDQAACSDQANVGSAGEAADLAANNFTQSLIPHLEAIPSHQ